MSEEDFLRVEARYSSADGVNKAHQKWIQSMTRRVLPDWVFSPGIEKNETFDCLREMLPVFTWSEFQKEQSDLTFYLLAHSWPGLHKFFLEMLGRWLIPGQRMDVRYAAGVDVALPDLGEGNFSLSEVTVFLENPSDAGAVRRNLPSFESEIRLGAQSAYHARRILEIKGLASDEKTAMIQENIADLIRRRPRDFDNDIFSEMQHFMVMCSRSFKAQREFRHISRIICSHYIFRRLLLEMMENSSEERRHVTVKLMRARIRNLQGSRPVLGAFVAINFLRRNEVLEQQHLLRAISHSIPGVRAVEGSFLVNRSQTDHLGTLYLEVEKPDGQRFTFEEERRLRDSLAADLRGCIEHQVHPVFMPRNDEEIMRSVLTLSHQLKYVRDIPQVMVSFDEQTDAELSFTVILLRVLRPGDPSIEEMFAQSVSSLGYSQDSVKVVGLLRKRYPKEATVFRLQILKEGFLRSDHAIDLRRARQAVVEGLIEVVGDVRDFNGGMISKQDELLAALKKRLGGISRFDELLLENFFYSMTPVVMRSVLEPRLLERFFQLFLSSLKGVKPHGVHELEEEEFAAVMITDPDFSGRARALRAVQSLTTSSLELVSVDLVARERVCIGFLLRSDDPEKRRAFLEALRGAFNLVENQLDVARALGE